MQYFEKTARYKSNIVLYRFKQRMKRCLIEDFFSFRRQMRASTSFRYSVFVVILKRTLKHCQTKLTNLTKLNHLILPINVSEESEDRQHYSLVQSNRRTHLLGRTMQETLSGHQRRHCATSFAKLC